MSRGILLRGVLAFCVLAVVLWGCFMPQDVTIYNPEVFATLEDGWCQVLDGSRIDLPDIQKYQNPGVGQPIVLSRTITADMADRCILFYGEHQTVTAMADQECLYNLSCPESMADFGSPGRTWVKIFLSQDMVGKTLTLSFTSPFALYHGVPTTLYLVPESMIYAVQVDFLLVRNTVALVMLVLAVVSYVNGFLWKEVKMRRLLLCMADVYLMVGLWLCAEVNVLAIWLRRASLTAVLAQLFLRILPIIFYHLFRTSLPYTTWRTKAVGALVWVNFLVSCLLQWVFGISMLHLVEITLAIIALGCFFGFWEIYQYHRSPMAYLAFGPGVYLNGLLLVAVLVEVYTYFHYQTNGQWLGIPLSVACLFHFVLTHIFMMRKQSATSQAKTHLEAEFVKLRKNPLHQQINAHFLYNSLNTIGAFCKTDGDKAYEAIALVSRYMRAYTHLIGATGYVALEDELDLMETYLAIQNMRFSGGFTLTIENDCDLVLVPPLTLQPLVENAITHGIAQGGTIQIVAHRRYTMAEIQVRDNGVGFDATKPWGIGLTNLQDRIQAMGGRMTVESGRGTTVTLLVPLGTWEGDCP